MSRVAEHRAGKDCFFKGCKWAPDGLCVLTASEDNVLRLFNLPDAAAAAGEGEAAAGGAWAPALEMREGETIFDYAWYPRMSSDYPETCVLAATSRDHPIHLWDAFSGALRCTYRGFNDFDEVAAAASVSFDAGGGRIFGGYDGRVLVFDAGRPGRDFRVLRLKPHLTGIVSCFAHAAVPGEARFAAGTYNGAVGLYDGADRRAEPWAVLTAGRGATQLEFGGDAFTLWVGIRSGGAVEQWDLRNPGAPVQRLERVCRTNQRVGFCLGAGRLVSGGTDGVVRAWRLSPDGAPDGPAVPFAASSDSVTGAAPHPWLPLLAVASGQRHYDTPGGPDSDSDSGAAAADCALRLWDVSKLDGWPAPATP